jgi:hypothetical protein
MTTLPPPPPAAKTTKPPDVKPAGLKFDRIEPGTAPSRIIINAVEGWGKTTFMAHARNPVIVRSPQESGFVTLRKADRVPDVPTLAAGSWPELLDIARSKDLRVANGTVCFDVLGGFEELCRLHVLKTAFGGQDDKYAAYGKGNAMMANEWMKFLAALEDLSETTSVIIASHARVARAKDPMLDDYDRYVADCHEKVWAPTKRWADAVLFGTFFSFVDEGKGKGGTDRVIHTEHRATHDAKNRWGMPPVVKIPADPAKVYSAIFEHIPNAAK